VFRIVLSFHKFFCDKNLVEPAQPKLFFLNSGGADSTHFFWVLQAQARRSGKKSGSTRITVSKGSGRLRVAHGSFACRAPRSPRGFLFSKIIQSNFSFGSPEESGTQRAGTKKREQLSKNSIDTSTVLLRTQGRRQSKDSRVL